MANVDNLGVENEGTPTTPVVDNSQEKTADDKAAERRAQQEQGSKQEVDKYKSKLLDVHVKNAQNDGRSLLDLHTEDPKLAEEVAKKFGYDSFEAAKKQIEVPEEEPKKGLTEDDFEKFYQNRKSKDDHENATKKVDEMLATIKDDDVRKKVETYYDKITKGKTLTESSAIEFAEMATLYVNRDRTNKDAYQDGLAMLGSTGVSSSKKGSNTKPKMILNGAGELVLDTNKQG